jgi:hypothetical protein
MTNIKKNVMAAVFLVRGFRMAKSPTALKIYAIMLSIWGISRLVWVSKVFENFSIAQSGGISSTFSYTLAAIEHTHLGVQVMLLVVACAFVSLLTDTFRSVPARRSFAA